MMIDTTSNGHPARYIAWCKNCNTVRRFINGRCVICGQMIGRMKIGSKVVAVDKYDKQIVEGVVDGIDGTDVYVRTDTDTFLLKRSRWDIKVKEE